MTPRIKLLLCDDDSLFASLVQQALEERFEVTHCLDTDLALGRLKKEAFQLLLLDVAIRTPTEGLDAIPKFRETEPELPIVVLSGNVDFSLLRRAIRLGAWDYVAKDFQPDDLKHAIDRVLEKSALLRRRDQQNREVRASQERHHLVGKSAAIEQLRKLIDRARASSGNVVITGETGSGKEVVARLLRKTLPDGSLEPFFAIDSSTIQGSTAESILFGHVKGAFTGADENKKGIFEEANGGVVYFDEIANMPLAIQAKLLRVVQEKEVLRLGSSRTVRLDFRVICATNRDLDKLTASGEFKDDLLQRLNVIPLQLPPLRERKEDIPLLVEFFSRRERPGHPALEFSKEARACLERYPWPGNIRELANLIAYLLAMADSSRIEVSDLPPKLGRSAGASASESSTASSLEDQLSEYERSVLEREWARTGGNVALMAKNLQVDRSNLYRKLKHHGIYSAES